MTSSNQLSGTEPAPIVAAVDGSEHALSAVRWAASAAEREGRRLLIVTALAPVGPSFSLTAVSLEQAAYDADREFASAALDIAVGLAQEVAPDISVGRQFVEGKPSLALRQVSSRAHTMVVGRRGLGGVAGLLLGSVSTDIAAHSDCPVVIVSEGELPVSGPVLVGVDGSPTSTAAIAQAFAQASLLDTSILAVHSYKGFSSDVFHGHGDETLAQLHDEHEQALGSQLAGYRQDLPDVTVGTVVTTQSPAQSISELAVDAQLVVLGSRGRGGFRGLLLGSTSQAVMHVSTVPLMIVHGDGTA